MDWSGLKTWPVAKSEYVAGDTTKLVAGVASVTATERTAVTAEIAQQRPENGMMPMDAGKGEAGKGNAGKGKEIGSAETQLAETRNVQHSVTEASNAQGKTQAPQTLHVPLVAVCPDGTNVTVNVACDTNSECDLIELSVAQKLRQNGVSWGTAGGILKVVGGGELLPAGSLRLLLTTKSSTASLTLPRSLLFVCEPEIVENASCDVVIGWPTLRSTGIYNKSIFTEPGPYSAA